MDFIGGMFVGAIVGFFAAVFCVAANDDDERGDRNDDRTGNISVDGFD